MCFPNGALQQSPKTPLHEGSRDPALGNPGGVLVWAIIRRLGTNLDLRIGPVPFFTGAACATRSRAVPIRPFLDRDDSFGPEDIAKMSAAFEATLGKLGLIDRSDPATAAVAKLIIEFAKVGERDPERLCAMALQQLSK
jgi:hypothetical protein